MVESLLNAELKALIDAVQVVSFDVFDTLLLRHQFVPADVFDDIPSTGGGAPFRLRRILAERATRWRYPRQPDISVRQIYELLPSATPEAEIAAEKRATYRNPELWAVFQYARTAGKRLIAVSDMYLPAATIADLLANAGFSGLEEIFVSNEIGHTKHSGALFLWISEKMGVPGESFLHIGDNEQADYRQAIASGWRAYHVPSPTARFLHRNPIHPKVLAALLRRKTTSHSLLLGLMRDHLAKSPDDYWYVLGFATVGPIANAFVQWVAARAHSLDVECLHFLARDGCLPEMIFRLRYPDRASRYTLASRRLFLVPALAERLDNHTLQALCSGLPGTPAQDYWYRLGLDDMEIKSALDAHFPDGSRIWTLADRAKLELFFRQIYPLLREHAKRERNALERYLAFTGLLRSQKRSMIVDIGWRASSQRCLEGAFPELLGTAGSYFGLEADAYSNGLMNGYLFDRGRPRSSRNVAMHCVELVELMFSAPEPSIRHLAGGSDPTGAIREPTGPEEEFRSGVVASIHRGAMDFTEKLLALEESGYQLDLNRSDVLLFLKSILFHPRLADCQMLGAIPHALGLGADRYEPILPQELPSNLIETFREHFGSQRKRLYWPRGLVAAVAGQRGPLPAFGTRIATTAYALAMTGRHLIGRALSR